LAEEDQQQNNQPNDQAGDLPQLVTLTIQPLGYLEHEGYFVDWQ